jgi:hypothetical protein
LHPLSLSLSLSLFLSLSFHYIALYSLLPVRYREGGGIIFSLSERKREMWKWRTNSFQVCLLWLHKWNRHWWPHPFLSDLNLILEETGCHQKIPFFSLKNTHTDVCRKQESFSIKQWHKRFIVYREQKKCQCVSSLCMNPTTRVS